MSPGKSRGPGGGGNGGGFDIPLPGMPGDDDEPDDQDRQPPAGGAELPTAGKAGQDLPQMEQRTPAFREAVYQFVTGRQGAAGAAEGDVRAQLIAAYGTSPRDPSRPDTAAAAKSLGVSQRSVQRWVKRGGGLSTQHRSTLDRRARQAMTTKRGRARALAAAQRTGSNKPPPGSKGRGISVGGVQGVVSSISDNYRDRDAAVQVTSEDLEQLQQFWVEHGDAGAAAWLHQHYDAHYTQGWHFQDIDDIGWSDSRNY